MRFNSGKQKSTAPDRNSPPKPPATLEDAYKIIVALWHEVMRLREENAALQSQVVKLEEKLNTNSSNSSMPPSSDPPSTEKKKNKKKKGKRGGQLGHEGKTRELVPKEDVDEFVDCSPDKHCKCGGHVLLDKENPERHQKLELPEVAVLVWEYLIYSGVCLTCGKIHRGKLPDDVPSGMLGPRAMATVSVLSGKYHLSKRGIEEILSDLFGLDICLGTVSNTEARVSDVLEEPVEEAKEFVKAQGFLHADEMGHKQGGGQEGVDVGRRDIVCQCVSDSIQPRSADSDGAARRGILRVLDFGKVGCLQLDKDIAASIVLGASHTRLYKNLGEGGPTRRDRQQASQVRS